MKTSRIAMWSGPRNISTAMMRAFENRQDASVWDEPLYGPYLASTGLPHPGAAEVIAAQGPDWRGVVQKILGPVPGDKPVFYQKHMSHHLLPGMDRNWLDDLSNCFLIRRPQEVVSSYARTRPEITLEDLGMREQVEIFERECQRTGAIPPVLDSKDVLQNPELMLGLLCDRLGIAFSEDMLSWPAGPRDSDGVWAKYWYGSVEASTGFAEYAAPDIQLEPELQAIANACQPWYEKLYAHRIRP